MKRYGAFLVVSIMILLHSTIIYSQPKKNEYPQKLNKLSYKKGQHLGSAWKYYNNGNYQKAIEIFLSASSFPETEMEANLGLAYSYMKLNERDKALYFFERLVSKNYRLEDTLPNLMALLLEEAEYIKASLYLNKFKEEKKNEWLNKIREGLLLKRFDEAKKTEDLTLLSNLMSDYLNELKQCTSPHIFYGTAQIFLKKEGREDAIMIYKNLLSSCPEKHELRLGIYYNLKSLLPYPEILKLLNTEIDKTDSPAYKQKLTELKLHSLKEQLANLQPDSLDAKELAKEILTVNPDEESALISIAWHNYYREQYEAAYEYFSKLYKKFPQNQDYAVGLSYTLIKMDRLDETLKIAESFERPKKDLMQIKVDIYFRKAGYAYENKDYSTAELYLNKLLKLDHENTAGQSLLAWSLYNQGKFKEALPLFLSIYEKQNDPQIADIILVIYEKTKNIKEAFSFADSLAKSNEKSLQKVAGDYFFKHNCPIKAAETYNNPEACYFNSDKPQIKLLSDFRYKSGDKGFSRLVETSADLDFSYPFSSGNNLIFSLTHKRLSAGDAPTSPFAGSYFKNISQVNDIITSESVTEPKITFEKEGISRYILQTGTTPVGSTISPLPTFFAQIEQKNWHLNIHQSSVKESILSYVGLKDPYGDKDWGRVVMSGAEGEYVLDLYPSYWLSLKGGYDYYWGENILKNESIYGTATIGKTIQIERGSLYPGLSLFAKHFKYNSNFFTFGHGGYFSPQNFLSVGPSLRFQSKPCQTFWIDGQFAINYLYYKTDSVSQYPLETAGTHTTLNFEEDSFHGLGYNFQLQGFKLFAPNWEGGGSFKLNKSTDYTEWIAGLTIRYFFGIKGSGLHIPYTP